MQVVHSSQVKSQVLVKALWAMWPNMNLLKIKGKNCFHTINSQYCTSFASSHSQNKHKETSFDFDLFVAFLFNDYSDEEEQKESSENSNNMIKFF